MTILSTCVSFFFQAEDGIRDDLVTGVQTCALPISEHRLLRTDELDGTRSLQQAVFRQMDLAHAAAAELAGQAVLAEFPRHLPGGERLEIGRASCRERV